MPYSNKDVQRAYQREWYAKRRLEWIAENGPCQLCGSEQNLEVDHVDGATKFTHRIWSYSKQRREAELAKCRVLCETCHKQKTKTESIKGEDVSNAKFRNKDILAMRADLQTGMTLTEASRKYDISRGRVSEIKNRKRWKHL